MSEDRAPIELQEMVPTVSGLDEVADHGDRRQLVASGLKWGALYQGMDAIVSFAAMLLLVRLIGPSEYGRAAAAVGVLALLNSFNAVVFVGHTLQLSDRTDPDWQLHWTFAFYIQLALSLLCHGVALVSWVVVDYRPIAPLLHLAGLGLLLDWPNQFGATMLRRDLNLRRVQILSGISTIVKLGCTVGVAIGGGGAVALVLGNNVVGSLPFGVDLLLLRRWRPRRGWWRLPNVRAYRAPASFGAQRVLAGIAAGAFTAMEAAVLPASLGFAAFGLLTRARALYGTTLGRVANIAFVTVYPFLPREADRPALYARQAGRFLHAVLLFAVPGALFLGIEGQQVSRVLYGQRWEAMDPLIWPGVLWGLAVTILSVSCLVLMAAGRVRECLVLEVFAATMTVPALAIAWTSERAGAYCWVLAAAQGTAALVALYRSAALLEPTWTSSILKPPIVITLFATIATLAAQWTLLDGHQHLAHLCGAASVYFLTLVVALRLLFPRSFSEILEWIPGGRSFGLVSKAVVPAEPGVSP